MHDWVSVIIGLEFDMVKSLADQMLYSATKITAVSGGQDIGYGTGFYLRVDLPELDSHILVLVTNKHVIKNADQINFKAHVGTKDRKPSGQHLECELSLESPNIVNHPDKDIDLCSIFIGGIIDAANRNGTPIFFVGLTDGIIPSEAEWSTFDSSEELVMVGCPNGIYDDHNNLAIMRHGHTATPLGKNYNGSPSFLIDMACFPGSSGSPVFLYNGSQYYDPIENATIMGGRIKLVGVLFQGPLIKSSGRIVFQGIPSVESDGMMHLGEVIKSSEIRRLSDEVRKVAVAMIEEERGIVNKE